jgi:hypothetical protein
LKETFKAARPARLQRLLDIAALISEFQFVLLGVRLFTNR